MENMRDWERRREEEATSVIGVAVMSVAADGRRGEKKDEELNENTEGMATEIAYLSHIATD